MNLLLRWLLHLANSSPPLVGRRDFYALKDRLLERYAERAGEDVQVIRKECWGYYDGDGCAGERCAKCGGTGVFETVYVLLHRYRWGPYVFHRPVDVTWSVSMFGPPTIEGRVSHANYGRLSAEALLWLYVLTGEWGLLWRTLRSTRRYGWWVWPLLNVQRVAYRYRRALDRRWTASVYRRGVDPAQVDELPF